MRRIELGAKLDRMKQASTLEVLESPILMMGNDSSFDQMRAQYYAERNSFNQLEKEVGPKNPELIKQKLRVDDLYAALKSEAKRIVGHVQGTYEAALANERALVAEVERYKHEAFELGPKIVDVQRARARQEELGGQVQHPARAALDERDDQPGQHPDHAHPRQATRSSARPNHPGLAEPSQERHDRDRTRPVPGNRADLLERVPRSNDQDHRGCPAGRRRSSARLHSDARRERRQQGSGPFRPPAPQVARRRELPRAPHEHPVLRRGAQTPDAARFEREPAGGQDDQRDLSRHDDGPERTARAPDRY